MSTMVEPPLPLIDQATEIAIFLHDLESLDECKCKVTDHRGMICSIHVVAMLRYTCAPQEDKKVCQTIREAVAEYATLGIRCQCGTRIADCWRIVPI